MSDSWYPGALAAQDNYQPVDNPWLPDVGQPLISAGSRRISEGVPAVNQFIGNLLAPRQRDENSPVAYRTASPMVNITEQDIQDATEAAMASSGGGLGIKAYHSSPHDFDKFDLSKIGSGEGAQVYGHGLYFAENPAVSGQGGEYWNSFSRHPSIDPVEQTAAIRLREAGFDRAKAIEMAQRDIEAANTQMKGWSESQRALSFPQRTINAQEAQIALLRGNKPVGPRTYEVDIKADPAHFLDWNRPLTQHPRGAPFAEEVGRQLSRGPSSIPISEAYPILGNRRAGSFGAEAKTAGRAALSDEMREAGIPGIKYLDQQSRFSQALYNDNPIANAARQFVEAAGGNAEKAGKLFYESNPAQHWAVPERDEIRRLIQMAGNKPTSNYVVFNPGIIDILRKYGIAGAAPLGMGVLAAQDQYNQP